MPASVSAVAGAGSPAWLFAPLFAVDDVADRGPRTEARDEVAGVDEETEQEGPFGFFRERPQVPPSGLAPPAHLLARRTVTFSLSDSTEPIATSSGRSSGLRGVRTWGGLRGITFERNRK